MAQKINAQVIGGSPRTFDDVQTVGDVAKLMGAEGYTATVNGEPAQLTDTLEDYSYVNFAPAVKGGAQ